MPRIRPVRLRLLLLLLAGTALAVLSAAPPSAGVSVRAAASSSPLRPATSRPVAHPTLLSVRQPAVTAYSANLTVSPSAVVDAQGVTWRPTSGLVGGTTQIAQGGIGDTGSPGLYRPARVGVQRWTVPVPAAGSYALDILICDTSNAPVGGRIFSVAASDGVTTRVLATDLDVTAAVKGWHPYHLTATVTLARPSLVLTFTAKVGAPIVSGLAIHSATVPNHTLLKQTFTGAAGSAPDPSIWGYQNGVGWDGGVQAYTAARSNSALTGSGALAVTAVRQDYAGADGTAPYTSARLVTKGRFTFGYGHVEARMKMPAGSGMWPAFWALGANDDLVNWPRCGEIDIVEGLGRDPALVAGHTHSLGDAGDPLGYLNQRISSLGFDWNSGSDTSAAFHTYAIDYRPGSITFLFDGHPYFVATPEDLRAGQTWPFTGAQNYLLLNLAVGNSDWTGYAPDEPVGTKHTLLVDQVTVTG